MKITIVGMAIDNRQNGLWLDGVRSRPLIGRSPPHSHQPGGVVLLGVVQDLVGQAFFHLFAPAQHLDAVGHLRHHGQVMGDVERRCAVLANQRLEQDQDLDLCGDIECGGRLI